MNTRKSHLLLAICFAGSCVGGCTASDDPDGPQVADSATDMSATEDVRESGAQDQSVTETSDQNEAGRDSASESAPPDASLASCGERAPDGGCPQGCASEMAWVLDPLRRCRESVQAGFCVEPIGASQEPWCYVEIATGDVFAFPDKPELATDQYRACTPEEHAAYYPSGGLVSCSADAGTDTGTD
jgi:hypothetical protein